MRRWNGWGDDGVDYPLPPTALDLLGGLIGWGSPPHDATYQQAVETVPPGRLPDHPLVSADSELRLRRARGHSLPDWVALRSGRIGSFPDGVARPITADQVRDLMGWAAEHQARIIPYGGGTSVVGHINPQPDDQPVLTVDLRRLNRLGHLDPVSRLATFGAGVSGPELEAQLRVHGFTLGHFPQSFEYSTLGGWVATRSSGQQSLGYGRIEDLFAGGRLEAPAGTVVLPPHPGSAAGPDLRQVVLGSEGRLGILTEATVRVTPSPEKEEFHGVFLPDFTEGREAIRRIVQANLPLSLIRLSSGEETTVTLALAGHPRAVGALETVLASRKIGEGKTLLIVGFSGPAASIRRTRRQALHLIRQHGGVHLGRFLGNRWRARRFTAPYLRNTLWELGYAVDTFETSVGWAHIPEMAGAVETASRGALEDRGERGLVFSHISHVYRDGAALYTTCIFRTAGDPDETIDRWRALKGAASETILRGGGTISHHHGVGLDHAPYLEAEKGTLGVAVLGDVLARFDPNGLMNPGKLIP